MGFQEEIAEMRPALLRFARSELREPAWAEDVVAETLVAALESADSFAGRSHFKTWAMGILKNKILDHFRLRQREVSVDARTDASQIESLDELYDDTGHMAVPPLDWGDPEESIFVMLRRARMRLRERLEIHWFRTRSA